MTINEFRKEYASALKRHELFEKAYDEISSGLWHFGYDTEGHIIKIEPFKVILTIR